jgi:hypothetical protein
MFRSTWYHYIHSIVITSWNWKRSMIFDHFGIIILIWLWFLAGTENVLRFLINLVSLYSFDCDYVVELYRFYVSIALVSLYSFDCDYFLKLKMFHDFWSFWCHYTFLTVITSWNRKPSMIFDHFSIIIFIWLWLYRRTI